MAFYPIQLFLNKAKEEYNISQYRIDVFYDNKNVFSYRKGISFFENILCKKQIIINPKIIACLSLIMLSVTGKVSLDDNIQKHISEFPENEMLEDLIINYLDTSESEAEFKSFEIISEFIKTMSGYSIEKYSELMVIKPMKLSSMVSSSNAVATTPGDYCKLCSHICNRGRPLSKHKYLKNSIEIFARLTEKTQRGYLSYADKNGSYTLIDSKNKILAIYNQHPTGITGNQYIMFDELQTLIYDCLKSGDFPKGFNLFP